MPLLSLYVLILTGYPQKPLPPGMPKSLVPAKARIDAFNHMRKLIKASASKGKEFQQADLVLNRASVSEPLGDSAYRILVGPNTKSGHLFQVVPLFAKDRKSSQMFAEFLSAKPVTYVGKDPDAPVLFIHADAPGLDKALKTIAKAIATFGSAK